MVDDIRRPRAKQTVEDKQTESVKDAQAAPSLEAPHSYGQEEGFAAAKTTHKLRLRRWPHLVLKHASRKEQLLGGSLAAVLIIGGAGGVYGINKSFNSKPATQPPIAQKIDAQPTVPATEASRLTGTQISPELNKRPVVSVQIENSPEARPQAGLKDAGVVYEAIAEGGITRFNASFLESQPDYIGPVRSVRPYYAVLAAPFDPVFVHAGGSADGLNKIRELGLKDLDHGANGGAFRRASDRYAPHNLYTSMADLDRASSSRGYTSSEVKSFPRKAEKPGQAVTARTIDLAISSALYNVHYDYDAASNTYKRTMGGRPHTDHRSGHQITPKTVVALVTPYSRSGIYSVYQTTGSGQAYVFQDGIVQVGSWSKAGDKEQFVFSDETGKPLPLNAGQTWLTLVKAPNAVTYSP